MSEEARTERPAEDDSPREPVVTVDGVVRSFGPVTVLDGVSFELEAGTVTAVVGPNGSGKTTLLRVVAGLLPADDGDVAVRVRDARRVGYLPQEPAFRPSFTVAETLSYYADLLGPRVTVDDHLERVGLADVRDRRVDALSGGMRRLLGVAVATIGDPPLVVLDEPTGDLDPLLTEYIFDLTDDLAGAGAAVLLATHNLAGAAEADRVLVLDRGGVVDQGTPGEVTATARTDTFPAAFRTLVGDEFGPRTGVSE